jgi:hypothetical protein
VTEAGGGSGIWLRRRICGKQAAADRWEGAGGGGSRGAAEQGRVSGGVEEWADF